jgi:class 3 adenylate cyclase/tetratricopeptide (TPR) repeat protein
VSWREQAHGLDPTGRAGQRVSAGRAGPTVARRVVTVLFADIVGFTELADRLDLEDVSRVQESFFTLATETVRRWGGQVLELMGDGVLAAFGLSRTRDDDPKRATRAALALVSAMETLEAELGLDRGGLRLRVALSTGEVLVTGSGSAPRLTGDVVNVAARLQATADPGAVVVTEVTALAIADEVQLTPLSSLALKGKSRAQRVATVLGLYPEASRRRALGVLGSGLVGRADDLGWLHEAWRSASRSTARMLLIVAPPGVGKSRLVDEFVPHQPCRELRARLRADTQAPFDGVAQLFRAAAAGARLPALDSDVRESERALSQLFADTGAARERAQALVVEALRFLCPLHPAPAVIGDMAARHAIWIDALDGLAHGLPQSWVVEDVHWAGPDLLDFLALAGTRAGPGGRLLVCTARPSLFERAADWARVAGAEVRHLSLLDVESARHLVHEFVGDALPRETIEALVRRSDGNPLFIEEVLRGWVAVGLITPSENGWAASGRIDDIAVPTSVRAAYGAQLDDLPREARLTASIAAVIGRRFPVAAAHAMAELGVGGTAVDAGAGIGLLTSWAFVEGPSDDERDGTSYAFRHELLRDAAYAALTRAERTRLHVAVADWLAACAPDPNGSVAEVIARHLATAATTAPTLAIATTELDSARLRASAASWLERAATAATNSAAYATARDLLEQSIELTSSDPAVDASRRWTSLAAVMAHCADMDRAAEVAQRGLDLAMRSVGGGRPPAVSDALREVLAEAAFVLGRIWLEQLRFFEALHLAETTLRICGSSSDVETAKLLTLRGAALMATTNDYVQCSPDIEQARTIASAHGAEAVELQAASVVSMLRVGDWDMLQGTDMSRTCALAGRLGRPDIAAATEFSQAMIALASGANPTEALARERALAEAFELLEERAWTAYLDSEVRFMHGDWDGAAAAGRLALALSERNGYHRVAVRTWMTISEVALVRLDHDLLRRLHAWYAPRARLDQHSPYGLLMYAAMELRLREAGYPAIAELRFPALVAGVGLPQVHGAWFVGADRVLDAMLDAGFRTSAATAVDTYLTRVQSCPSLVARGFASYWPAKLALRHDSEDPSIPSRIARAIEAFRAARAPWFLCRALEQAGRRGDASAAREAAALRRSLAPGTAGAPGA